VWEFIELVHDSREIALIQTGCLPPSVDKSFADKHRYEFRLCSW
jgi:hypothetical protein